MADKNLLKKVYLFESLNDEELSKVAEIAQTKDYIAGDTIFSEGREAHSLFVIRSGSVDVIKKGADEDAKVATLAAGAHFGEMPYFDPAPRGASVEAKENTQVFEISYADLNALIAADEKLGFKIFRSALKTLCRRIRQTTSDLSALKELKLRHI